MSERDGDGMTEDVTKLAALSRELPAIDLEPGRAERIALRARRDLGRGPSLRQFVEPAIAAVVTGSYLVWAVIKVLEALR